MVQFHCKQGKQPAMQAAMQTGKVLLAVLVCSILVLSVVSPAAADPQVITIRLSGVMPDYAAVGGRALSPDGAWVVFTADLDDDGLYNLYSVPIVGGEPQILNDSLVPTGVISQWEISPDSQWVLYLQTDVYDLAPWALYRAPIDGGAAITRPSQELLLTGSQLTVMDFEISPDSEHVVFRLSDDTYDWFDLYSVSMSGGVPVQLNPGLETNEWVTNFDISPDSRRVIFKLKSDDNSVENLRSVLIGGGTSLPLTSISAPKEGVHSFTIAPNSKRVVYSAYQDNALSRELYTITITGTLPARVTPVLADNRQVNSFEITPDSLAVVYTADQQTDNKSELFSAPISGGGTFIKLNGDLIADGDVLNFEISEKYNIVVYRADSDIEAVVELFAVGILGANRVRLHPPLTAGKGITGFKIAPNSLGVVYRGKVDNDIYQLYSILIDGTSRTPLTNITSSSVYLASNFEITPNNLGVVFLADLDTLYTQELYSVYSLGGFLQKWNVPLAEGGNATSFIITPDSRSLVYTADAEINGKIELYRAYSGYPLYLPMAKKP